MNSIPVLQSPMRFHHAFPVPGSPTSCAPVDTTSQRRTSRVWDESMRDLMRGLEQICGSQGSDTNRRSSKPDLALSPAVSTPPTPPSFSLEIQQPERGLPNNIGSHNNKRFRHHSDQPLPRQIGQRRIFVRHIETHQELNNKLIEICRRGSVTEVERLRTSGHVWRAAQKSALESKTDPLAEEAKGIRQQVRKDKRRVRFQLGEDERDICLPTEKDQRDNNLPAYTDQKDSRIHGDKDQRDIPPPEEKDQKEKRLLMEEDDKEQPIQVEIGHRNVEDLVVAVRDRRHLTVVAISCFGDNILYDSLLSDDIISRPLLCHLTGNGLLYIRRLPPSMAREDFIGTESTFIPVIRRNEASLELTVVLHIPDDFRFDDVIVRTVDSQLVVIGRKRQLSLLSLDGAPHDSVRPTFNVCMQLPEEVKCRSVNAFLTEEHQLIVKGEIDPVPRRNSV